MSFYVQKLNIDNSFKVSNINKKLFLEESGYLNINSTGSQVFSTSGPAGPTGNSITGPTGTTGPSGNSITGPVGPVGSPGPPGLSITGPTGSFGGTVYSSILPYTGYTIHSTGMSTSTGIYFPTSQKMKLGGIDIGSPEFPFGNIWAGDAHFSSETIYIGGVAISSDPVNSILILPSSIGLGDIYINSNPDTKSIDLPHGSTVNNVPIGSIKIKGVLQTPPISIIDAAIADAYIVTNTSPSHMWVYDGTEWKDAGPIQGPKGDQGFSITGPKGDSIIGPTGVTGPIGPQGNSITGPQGLPGTAVARGDTGPTGPYGGPPGPSGPTGPNGNLGPTGPQGFSITGPTGTSGIIGPTGPKGNKYGDIFNLTIDKTVGNDGYNIIFNNMITSDKFIIENDYYIYTGVFDNILLNIQLLYKWITPEYAYRFILNIIVRRNLSSRQEIICNTLIGVNDYLGIKGIFSNKIPIDIQQNDRLYINILKKENNHELSILKNSGIQIEYI